MKLQLGPALRQLRRGRDLTQEDLAELLGVSCQSVSRWENGACYPDMELLPVLASFFGVTVDQLLGVDQALEARKIQDCLDRFQTAISVGDIDGCIQIARQGTAEFPGSFALMNKLMYALFVAGDETGNIPNWRENQERYDREIVSLGERIIKFCPDQDIRLEATARLGFHHCDRGRRVQGRAILDSLPPLEYCRENWIWWGLEPEERLPHTREQISRGYSAMRSGLYNFQWGQLLPDEDLIPVYETIFAIDALLRGDRPDGFSFGDAQLHCQMAAVYARLGKTGETLEQLTIAAEIARWFDQRPEEYTVRSPILGEKHVRRSDFDTADSRGCRQIMAESWMTGPDFAALQGTDAFEAIRSSLQT